MMNFEEKGGGKPMQRRRWTMIETEFLLTRYLARIDEMRPRRKMIVFRDIAQDLVDSGIARLPVTSEEVQNKIKSLLRSYREGQEGIGTTSIKPGHPFYMLLRKIMEAPNQQAGTRTSIFKTDQNIAALSPWSIANGYTDEVSDLLEREIAETLIVEAALPDSLEPPPSEHHNDATSERSQDMIKARKQLRARKFIEKKRLVEYKEKQKDKRFRMKLEFLRQKERNKQKLYVKEQRFYEESIEILREIKEVVKTAFSTSSSGDKSIEVKEIKTEPV